MSGGRRFVETLKNLSYPKSHDLQAEAFDWMFENDAVAPFLDWFIGNVGPANVLSRQEISEFQALESSSDGVLEGEILDSALRNSNIEDEDDFSEEKLKDEVAALEEELQRAERSRKKLLQLRNKLSLHHTSLTHKLTKLSPVESQANSQYKAALENCQADNLKVNTSLENLNFTMAELVSMYNSSSPDDTQQTPFLSQNPLQPIHQSEESFTQALTQFTKKQFFEGIAELAGHGDVSRYELLDISDPKTLVIQGEKAHVTEEDCKELTRIKNHYPTSQRGLMKALLEEARITAAHKLAEKRLDSISHELYPKDVPTLSERLEQCERQKNSSLNAALDIWENELPELLRVSGALQATHILSGDYNLKIARQDYFISKQDQLIRWLTTQKSRMEFLDMSYEVEYRHHKSTHRLMTAAERLLADNLAAHHKSMAFLTDPELSVARTARSTVDSRDTTVNRLHSIIDPSGGEERQLFLTYSRLMDDTKHFVERLTSLRDKLRTSTDSQEGKLAALEQNLRQCENMVYAGSSTKDGQPVLTPPAILDGITQLDRVLEDLTQSMMSLMGEYNNKLKILKGDPLLSRQRHLFVYFFTEPSQLRRELHSLSQQLQALRIT